MNTEDYPMLHPDYFYDEGKNPAMKDLVFLRAANYDPDVGEGHVFRTQYSEPYAPRRFFLFKDFKEFFEDRCDCNTIPKATALYAMVMGVCSQVHVALQGFFPFGRYGIRNYQDLHAYRRYGMKGVAIPAMLMGINLFTMYRATAYISGKYWNYVVKNERNWKAVKLKYETEFGDYGYSDQVYENKENRNELKRTMQEVLKIRRKAALQERYGHLMDL